MEKKHRDITVDGKVYGWTENYMGGSVTIWDGKKPILEDHKIKLNCIQPSLIESIIREKIIEPVKRFELHETLDKEWTAFLSLVPWDGYGSTIEESNFIFEGKCRGWVKKMTMKHGVDKEILISRYTER